MSLERLITLFGPEIAPRLDDIDVDEESHFIDLLEELAPLPEDAPQRSLHMGMRTVIVRQIASDDPSETWSTMQRLIDEGLDVETALTQLALEMLPWSYRSLSEHQLFDRDGYIAALADLPIPEASTIKREILAAAQADQGVGLGELADAVQGDSRALSLSKIINEHIEAMIGSSLAILAPNHMVAPVALVDGRTLTHRLNDVERELDVLTIGIDLGAFGWFDEVRLTDGTELDRFSVDSTHLAWKGPSGWLADFAGDDLLAVTVRVEPTDDIDPAQPVIGFATIEVIESVAAIGGDYRHAVQSAYDQHLDELWLPVQTEDIALTIMLKQPEIFDGPAAPIGDVCDQLGFTRNGSYVAHENSVWRNEINRERLHTIRAETEDPKLIDDLCAAVECLTDPDSPQDDIRHALDQCSDEEAIGFLADVLFDDVFDFDDDDPSEFSSKRLFELVERAITASKRPRERAVAHFLASVLHERAGQPLVAEQHLISSEQATRATGPVVERLGWYRFDRGDARGARAAWSQLADGHPALDTLEPFLNLQSTQPKIGRNDPCWCESGRKFKQCHQNTADLPALPDRIGWIMQKLTQWVDHSVGWKRSLVLDCTVARATGHPYLGLEDMTGDFQSELLEAAGDPIVIDAAITEGGLLTLFLHERGELLPEDEQLLLASWLTVARSVHEVAAVQPGKSITFRDLATGDETVVTERTASQYVVAGDRLCARLLPDGEGYQIVGGLFPVRAGTEKDVLELCDEGDALELCAWAGLVAQPPEIVHTPGLMDELYGENTIQEIVDSVDQSGTPEETHAAVQRAVSEHMQMAWLDIDIPLLDGLTPRQAAADPTRREQLERLLHDFEKREHRTNAQELGIEPLVGYDVAVLRRELGMD